MAKINGPLMSESASGLIGERLVFSVRKSGQQARFQRAQKDRITQKRTDERTKYKEAVEAWNILDTDIKETLQQTCAKKKMTCYNYFIQQYILGNISNIGFSIYGARNYSYFIYGKQ